MVYHGSIRKVACLKPVVSLAMETNILPASRGNTHQRSKHSVNTQANFLMSTYLGDHHLVNLGWIAMRWNMGCAKCPWWDLYGLLASSISLRTHEPLPVDDPPTHLKPLSWMAMRNLAYLNSHQLQSVYEQGLFNDNNTHRIRVMVCTPIFGWFCYGKCR